jgi:hypothetical protein
VAPVEPDLIFSIFNRSPFLEIPNEMHLWLRFCRTSGQTGLARSGCTMQGHRRPGRSSPWVGSDSEAANRLLALVYLYFECTIDHHDLVPF